MRVALVSDIHANSAAWNAVLADTAIRSADKIICLGDMIGYGPEPAEVLSSLHANVDYFVLGNHDAVVAGVMEPDGFNPIAKKLIYHTRNQLDERARDFLNAIPLSLKHDYFRFSHGSAAAPEKFSYVISKQDALDLWENTEDRIVCLGHTHIPRLHMLTPSGDYHRFKPPQKDLALKGGHRYIVNCGSVGLPRDGDFRAGYVILDTSAKTVRWIRLPYDIQAFRQAVEREYRDPELAGFLLKRTDRGTRRPVRELIDFTPGRSPVSDRVTDQNEIDLIRSRLKRWQAAALLILATSILIAGSILAFMRTAPRYLTIEGNILEPVPAQIQPGGWQYDHLHMETPAGHPLPGGWAASISDARRQSVGYQRGSLNVFSENRRPITVYLRPQSARNIATIRWTVEGSICDQWEGQMPVLVLDHIAEDGSIREGAERLVLRKETDRIFLTRTTPIRSNTTAIRPGLHFQSAGKVEIVTLLAEMTPTSEKILLIEGPIDLNSTTAQELERIPGIGPTLAGRIIQYRQLEGEFESVGELIRIQGIGERLLSDIEKFVIVGNDG